MHRKVPSLSFLPQSTHTGHGTKGRLPPVILSRTLNQSSSCRVAPTRNLPFVTSAPPAPAARGIFVLRYRVSQAIARCRRPQSLPSYLARPGHAAAGFSMRATDSFTCAMIPLCAYHLCCYGNAPKKKGCPEERPKSREETPVRAAGTQRHRDPALQQCSIQYTRATHSPRAARPAQAAAGAVV
jgi:hypothetical protein